MPWIATRRVIASMADEPSGYLNRGVSVFKGFSVRDMLFAFYAEFPVPAFSTAASPLPAIVFTPNADFAPKAFFSSHIPDYTEQSPKNLK